MKLDVIKMVKDKKVSFEYYLNNELWYKTECGYLFPVPVSDCGDASFLKKDKATLFMRYIKAFDARKNKKIPVISFKELVGRPIVFEYYRKGEFWFKTEEGIVFPILKSEIKNDYLNRIESKFSFKKELEKYNQLIEESKSVK